MINTIIERILEEELNKVEYKINIEELRKGLENMEDSFQLYTEIKKRLIKKLRSSIYKPTENNTLKLCLYTDKPTPYYIMQRGKITLVITQDDMKNLFGLTEPNFAAEMAYIQIWGKIIKDAYKTITNLNYNINTKSI